MEDITKFHQLRIEKVLPAFHIKKVIQCTTLNEWTNTTSELSDIDHIILNMALERFEHYGLGWNEEELKMHFISSVLNLVNINVLNTCKTFFERPLSGIIGQYEINVITDCMIASYNEGGEPQKPFFFLQEFKQKQLWGKTDPQGQMLAAMLLAQKQNADSHHLYGCYVIERHWFFTTLIGSDYCVSQSYDATKKTDLHQIIFILRKLKEIIVMQEQK